VEISALRKPSAGVSNETVLFDARVGSGPTEHLVARLTPAGPAVFPEYDLARQYRVMECLAESGVPVPPLVGWEADASVLGSPFYVMRKIDGEIPSEVPPYHAFGHCLALSPARRAAMWWSGIETLARIHRLDWRRLGLGFLGEPGGGTDALDRPLDYYARYLEWAREGVEQPILDAALAWLRDHRYAPRRIGLCWGDSRLPNVIYGPDDRVVGVLDWEMAFLGDPEADLAWWIFLDWCHSTGYGIPRLEGLPSREETIARYAELSGAPVEHLEWQEVFAALRYGVITVRVAHTMRAAGISIAAPDMETNNVCTQRLATLLGLPPPGAVREVTHVSEVTARVQFRLTGPGGSEWYLVADRGRGSRHAGVVDAPDVTLTASAADWNAIQRGELNRTEAFLGGKLVIEGDVSLLLQLEDMISKLAS
jgi:aminoglycoside phosphotransferase (APT) family kinase protein/putative sterol carrier protein